MGRIFIYDFHLNSKFYLQSQIFLGGYQYFFLVLKWYSSVHHSSYRKAKKNLLSGRIIVIYDIFLNVKVIWNAIGIYWSSFNYWCNLMTCSNISSHKIYTNYYIPAGILFKCTEICWLIKLFILIHVQNFFSSDFLNSCIQIVSFHWRLTWA